MDRRCWEGRNENRKLEDIRERQGGAAGFLLCQSIRVWTVGRLEKVDKNQVPSIYERVQSASAIILFSGVRAARVDLRWWTLFN